MLIDFKGKVALVTGGGSGVGKATVLALAESGAIVAVNDVKEAAAREVANEVKSKDGQSIATIADVSNAKQVDVMVSKVLEIFGRIDVLANIAGIFMPYTGYEVQDMSDESWDKMIDIHLKGTFNCTRAVARTMVKQRSGAIVNVSSINAKGLEIKGISNYAAAKAGILGFTKVAAYDLAKYGIRVNSVAPGFIDTPMTAYVSGEEKEWVCKQIPLGRFARPEEIANAICFLASDKASYITGSTLDINGGRIEYFIELPQE